MLRRYTRNGYYYMENINDIYMGYYTVEYGKAIEELDIPEGNLPNVLICFSGMNEVKMDFSNIISSVRVMITDYNTIREGYMEIPDYVEEIIINLNRYRNNRSRVEFIDLMDMDESYELIGNLIEEGNINELNSRGENLLIQCIKNNFTDYIGYLYDNMDEEVRDNITRNKKSVLYWMCLCGMEDYALRLIENSRTIKKIVNIIDDFNLTILDWACIKKMSKLALKLVNLMDEEVIRKIVNMETKTRYGSNDIIETARKNNYMDVVEILEKYKI